MIITADMRGVITGFNPAAGRLLGYGTKDLVGKKNLAFLHDPNDLASRARSLSVRLGRGVKAGLDAVLAMADLDEREEEWVYRRKDGSRVPVKLSITGVAVPGHRSAGYCVMGTDISIRKRAEQLLDESQANLEALISTTPDLVWSVDRSFSVIVANAPAQRAMGGSLCDRAGKSRPHTLPGTGISRTDWKKHYARALRGERFIVETRVRSGPGDLEYETSFGPIRSPGGGVSGVAVFCRDVTERNRVVENLRESELRFRALFEGAPVGVVLTGQDGDILMVNRHVEQLLGYGREELIGKKIEVLVPQRFRDAHVEHRARFLRKAGGSAMESGMDLTARQKDGSERAVSVSLSRIQTGAGVAFLTILSDRTERAKVQEYQRKSREAAEHSGRLKSEFMATLSHEIRTPLNAILGVSDLLAQSDLTSEQREHVDVLHIAGETLLQMINDVLDFSKLEAGKVALSTDSFDLRDCLETAVGLFEPTAEARGVTLRVDDGQDMPRRVVGDSARLRQVLVNLIGNACKFTEQGMVTVSAKIVERDGERGEIQCAVADTGIGIPQDKLARLFKPFSQADASTTRKYGGTGLGLAISAELVRLMGGKLWVESEFGKGSTFYFTIEVGLDVTGSESGRRDERDPVHPSSVRPSPSKGIATDGRMPSILLAEDNPVNRKVVLSLLATLGCQSDVAVNGLEVLEAVLHKRYDIILMDIQMPEMDGLDASRHLVKMLKPEERPVIIAVTAHSMKIHREECFAAGMDDYLSKPIRLDTLKRRLERWTGLTLRPGKSPGVVPASSADDRSTMYKHLGKLLEQTDAEFIKEFIELFISSAEEILRDVTTAFEAGDRNALERSAHSLLGASRNVGAAGLAERCREIEALAPAGNVEMSHLTGLQESFRHTRQALDGFTP